MLLTRKPTKAAPRMLKLFWTLMLFAIVLPVALGGCYSMDGAVTQENTPAALQEDASEEAVAEIGDETEEIGTAEQELSFGACRDRPRGAPLSTETATPWCHNICARNGDAWNGHWTNYSHVPGMGVCGCCDVYAPGAAHPSHSSHRRRLVGALDPSIIDWAAGLHHVTSRHFTGGALTHGKSLFYSFVGQTAFTTLQYLYNNAWGYTSYYQSDGRLVVVAHWNDYVGESIIGGVYQSVMNVKYVFQNVAGPTWDLVTAYPTN